MGEMRRLARITGALMVIAGVLTLAWALVVWRWQDPFTALYTHWQQSRLSANLDHQCDPRRRCCPIADAVRNICLSRVHAPRRRSERHVGVALTEPRGARATGVSPAFLRDAPLHRLREARLGAPARRCAVPGRR